MVDYHPNLAIYLSGLHNSVQFKIDEFRHQSSQCGLHLRAMMWVLLILLGVATPAAPGPPPQLIDTDVLY